MLAVQAVRRMRGGAQSQLMLGADGALWVVKFRNNPQGERVLANEFLATRIAAAVGLSVPACEVVEVSEWLVKNSPEMMLDLGRGERVRCATGMQFGSRFVGGLLPGQVVDYLPETQLAEVRNLQEFAGMLLVDKWTGNSNGRQAVFERRARERKYRAIFIDQGFCFNGNEWSFPDVPLRGVYGRNLVYEDVHGWESFEPWLSRLESLPLEMLGAMAEEIPAEWYGGDPFAMEQLLMTLMARLGKIRELVLAFRESERNPFPKWEKVTKKVVPGAWTGLHDASKLVM